MASLKAHLHLDDFLSDQSRVSAACEYYYYIELCWFASCLNFKDPPKQLKAGRTLIASYINENTISMASNSLSDIKDTLFTSITCADSIVARVGRIKMNDAFDQLMKTMKMGNRTNRDVKNSGPEKSY